MFNSSLHTIIESRNLEGFNCDQKIFRPYKVSSLENSHLPDMTILLARSLCSV